MQDLIADDFCQALGLPTHTDLAEQLPAWSFQDGFPGPQELFNCPIEYVTGVLAFQAPALSEIRYLRLSGNAPLSMLYEDVVQPKFKAIKSDSAL